MIEERFLHLYKLYGLRDDPFFHHSQGELHPVSNEEMSLYAEVDGFREGISRIKNWFSSNEKSMGKSVFIMIYGPPKSGRSSMVNYNVCYLRQTDKNKTNISTEPIIIPIEISDNHDKSPILKVLTELYQEIDILDDINIDSRNKLERLYSDYVFTANAEYQGSHTHHLVFSYSLEILEAKQKVPIIILENVLDYKQVILSTEVFKIDNRRRFFKNTPIVFFTTAKEDILKNFNTEKYHGFNVELTELTKDDVIDFLNCRWYAVSDLQSHPFDEKCIQEVFEKPFPFRAVIDILSKSLYERLDEIQKDKEQGIDYPSTLLIPPGTVFHVAWKCYGKYNKD